MSSSPHAAGHGQLTVGMENWPHRNTLNSSDVSTLYLLLYAAPFLVFVDIIVSINSSFWYEIGYNEQSLNTEND